LVTAVHTILAPDGETVVWRQSRRNDVTPEQWVSQLVHQDILNGKDDDWIDVRLRC